MGKYHLGEFEEVVMLTVCVLHGQAYGIAIIDEMEKQLGRKVSIGALQTVLRRLEDKGLLESELDYGYFHGCAGFRFGSIQAYLSPQYSGTWGLLSDLSEFSVAIAPRLNGWSFHSMRLLSLPSHLGS